MPCFIVSFISVFCALFHLQVLEKFLNDDDDMHDMNLTAKEQAASSYEPSLEVRAGRGLCR